MVSVQHSGVNPSAVPYHVSPRSVHRAPAYPSYGPSYGSYAPLQSQSFIPSTAQKPPAVSQYVQAAPLNQYTGAALAYPQSTASPYLVPSGFGSRNISEPGERKRVRSVVLNEELIGPVPEETVRYVEVPCVEEIVRRVPRREVVEIVKHVPKEEIEYTERIVEVPHLQYVDKTVEVPQIREVIKHVPRREVVEVPREVIRHVPKVETKIVQKEVEVPGEVIEVPKPYTVENKVMVPHHVDREVPMVVAQTVRPVLTESEECVDVDVVQYEPEMIPVDIHVPKAVKTEIISMGVVNEQHHVVQVPAAQYNTMLRMLNPHIIEQDSSALPFVQGPDGAVSFLGTAMANVQPVEGAEVRGMRLRPSEFAKPQHHQHRSQMSSTPPSVVGSQRRHIGSSRASHRVRGGTVTTVGTENNSRRRGTATPQGKKARGACPC